MKLKKTVFFFSIAASVCVVVNLLQLIYTVEATTGFYKQGLSKVGFLLFGVIALVSLFIAVLASTMRPDALNLPEQNIYMSLSALAMAFSVFWEITTEKFNTGVRPWQTGLLKIFGILTAIYFVLYALKFVFYINIPKLASIIPTLYYLVRMICFFTSIASLVIISDNLMLIITYSAILVFMLNFARIYNYIEYNKSSKALLISGLIAVIFCLSTAVPHIVLRLFKSGLHSSLSPANDFSLLFAGLFIAVFTFLYFHKAKPEKFLKNRFSFINFK